MRIPDIDVLRDELNAYHSEWEPPGARATLVDSSLPRITATLALLPEAGPESTLLELGAAPFLATVCLDRIWPGRLKLAGYAASGQGRATERQLSVDGRPEKHYEVDLFNIENDEFPYADESFDVVVFCELIEHLAVNPVWALSEIHRVLKPGGHVIITTPNALSLDRLEGYLYGGSSAVDRYMPVLGYGARHNREWHVDELQEVLKENGFLLEALHVRDLETYGRWTQFRRAWARFLLRRWSHASRRGHILLRARRSGAFRWVFPPRLYDHMQFYHLARNPFIEMGVNDSIQCARGWLPLEGCPPDGSLEMGRPIRRVNGTYLQTNYIATAIAHLRGDPAATRLAVRLRASNGNGAREVHGALTVRSPSRGDEPLARHPFTVPVDTWLDVDAGLTRAPEEREALELDFEVPAGSELLVRRLALESAAPEAPAPSAEVGKTGSAARDPAAARLRVTADDPEYRRQAAAEAAYWNNVHPMSLEACEGVLAESSVERYVNERFTGDPGTEWVTTVPRWGTFRRGLFLGISSPRRESCLLETNPQLHATLLDISARSVERRARELEKRFPGRITTAAADLNFVELQPDHYDLVVSSSTIHHVTNLEHLAFQIARALTPEGYFFLEDYVGEARFLFSAEKKRLFETIYHRDLAGQPGRRPGLAWLDPSDLSPFCGVRSHEILEVFRNALEEVQVRTAAALTTPLARSRPVDFDEVWARVSRWQLWWSTIVQQISSRLGLRRRQLELTPKMLTEVRLVGDVASDAGVILPGLAFAVYRKRRA